jgi:hypothetical protein
MLQAELSSSAVAAPGNQAALRVLEEQLHALAATHATPDRASTRTDSSSATS